MYSMASEWEILVYTPSVHIFSYMYIMTSFFRGKVMLFALLDTLSPSLCGYFVEK
jgi:hypothetical protein